MRRKRLVLVTFVVSAVVSGGAVAAALLGDAQSPAETTSSPTPISQQSPVAQVTWLCQHASSAAANNQSDGFLAWVNSQCEAEGPSALEQSASAAGYSSDTPIGNLMCTYSKDQVAAGTATSVDQSEASNCATAPSQQPTGIATVVAAPPALYNFTPTNRWSGYVSGTYTTIEAGSQSALLFGGGSGDTNASQVYVVALGAPSGTVYSTGTDDGPLSVTSESNNIVQLSASDGQTFAFSLISNSFASASAG